MSAILVMASGTRGDVEPFLAVGRALRRRGLRVLVATHDAHRGLVEAAGLEHRGLGTNPSDLLARLEVAMGARGSFLRKLAAVRRYHRDASASYVALASRAVPLMGEAALAVLALPTYFLHPVARALGVPVIACPLQPLTPSVDYPSVLLPEQGRLLRALGRSSHALGMALVWLPWWRPLARWARRELPAARYSPAGPLRRMLQTRVPFVYGLSGHVFARPTDWPAEHALAGFWLEASDAAPEGAEGEAVARFLQETGPGVPLLYAGFGSREYLYAGLIELLPGVLRELGVRAIVQVASVDLPPQEGILQIRGPLTHGWLFRRVHAVLHHGGAGTFARACRAGVPSLAAAGSSDSAFWVRLGHALGVSPRPLRRSATRDELRKGLRMLLSSTELRANAARLGEALRAEDGPGRAALLIERALPAKVGRY